MSMLTKKFCPNCGGDNMQMVAGGEIGMWTCSDCGYSGSVIPEKPVGMNQEDVKKIMSNSKKGVKGKK